MALDKASFDAKYTATGGSDIFRDSKPIVAADLREFANDIDDSVDFPEDAQSGVYKRIRVRLKTAAALPANTYTTPGGIPTITGNSNGALSIDGIAVSLNDSVMISEESTSFHNGVYTVTSPGTGFSTFILTLRIDSRTADQIAFAIYTILEGTVNEDTTWKQTFNETGGTIANVAYSPPPGYEKKHIQITISTASILTGNSLPVLLLAGQGSGTFIKIIGPIILKFKRGSASFATNTDFKLYYGSGVSAITALITSLLNDTADKYWIDQQVVTNSSLATTFENAGIYFKVSTGDPTSGTGSTLVIEFEYEVITL